MNTVAVGMSVAAFVVVMGTWVAYLAKIPSGKVPARPVGSIILQCVGIGLAVSAIVWSYQGGGGPGVAVIVPAAFALMMGATFLWLLTQRKTPIGDLKVEVGDKLLSFETTTSEGSAFHTNELAGKRTTIDCGVTIAACSRL
jgi:hypothetical protein